MVNNLILEEGEETRACRHWRERKLGKKRRCDGEGVTRNGGQWPTISGGVRKDRVMKKQRCLQKDEEDHGAICVRMRAVLPNNHWGTEGG
eukprot:CAMPEP_0206394928 /NCGR_PEP_ID=MMETSP0294-20121207/21715_1 /ASSEMBLY_ACC=CAM_ASM_000327 /TAXON_ID=39354 /ORGANISM="Heterosigma akashiwo, Strain CCMP2393" /LENGTH=89 /DNA_ID=CAMNT_0053849029 /DNA_START=946 /DNA_END=1211 /DNA_ORIENTATION=-